MNIEMPKLNPDKIYEAIRQGIQDGFYQMVRSGTDMPSADFYEFIKKGVYEAMMELGNSGKLNEKHDDLDNL